MLIHFVASKSNIKKEINNYRKIKKIINSLGHELSHDWIEEAYKYAINNKNKKNLDWEKINKINMEAIVKSDAVIAEASTKSFATGFQTALSIQQKKPTLILYRNDSLKGTFGSGINSDFVRTGDYTTNKLEEIISNFLEENTLDGKDMRFNFYIDHQINNYLRWASFTYGKTKAEVLRDLVKKEIDKKS